MILPNQCFMSEENGDYQSTPSAPSGPKVKGGGRRSMFGLRTLTKYLQGRRWSRTSNLLEYVKLNSIRKRSLGLILSRDYRPTAPSVKRGGSGQTYPDRFLPPPTCQKSGRAVVLVLSRALILMLWIICCLRRICRWAKKMSVASVRRKGMQLRSLIRWVRR